MPRIFVYVYEGLLVWINNSSLSSYTLSGLTRECCMLPLNYNGQWPGRSTTTSASWLVNDFSSCVSSLLIMPCFPWLFHQRGKVLLKWISLIICVVEKSQCDTDKLIINSSIVMSSLTFYWDFWKISLFYVIILYWGALFLTTYCPLRQ